MASRRGLLHTCLVTLSQKSSTLLGIEKTTNSILLIIAALYGYPFMSYLLRYPRCLRQADGEGYRTVTITLVVEFNLIADISLDTT